MKPAVRITLYVVLGILVVWFGVRFLRAFRGSDGDTKAPAVPVATNAPTTAKAKAAPAPAMNMAQAASNALAVATNASAVGSIATNAPGTTATNAPTDTDPTVDSGTQADDSSAPGSTMGHALRTRDSGAILKNLVGLVFALIMLGVLVARDLSKLAGHHAGDFLFNEDAVGVVRPEYDAAEQVWASGDFLEAIRLLREYYEANPMEIFVAIRIAEIYEKDLKNHLAAALEYEDILSKELPPTRWSWTAIHLCNIYAKMGQSDKSLALLRRIAVEFGQTPGAEKARKRLAQIDPDFMATMTSSTLAAAKEQGANPKAKPAKPSTKEPPADHLPTGFRPKK